MLDRYPYIYIMKHNTGVFKLGSSLDPVKRRRQLLKTWGKGMKIVRLWPHEMATSVETIAHSNLREYKASGFGSNPHTRLLKQQSCQLHGEPYQDWMVYCPKLHVQMKAPTKELAIKQWNDRNEGI